MDHAVFCKYRLSERKLTRTSHHMDAVLSKIITPNVGLMSEIVQLLTKVQTVNMLGYTITSVMLTTSRRTQT